MSAAKLATWISRSILLACLGGVIVVLADFLRFADNAVMATPRGAAPYADAIVVFTGRSDTRIQTGVVLLEQGRGQRLLISGVNAKVRVGELRQIAGGSARNYACCIDLGRDARDTVGNARELRAWAGRSGVDSILLVTDNFHMERSILEVGAVSPDLKVTPWPVAQRPFDDASWWDNGAALRGLAQEYVALTTARIRLFLHIDLKETV